MASVKVSAGLMRGLRPAHVLLNKQQHKIISPKSKPDIPPVQRTPHPQHPTPLMLLVLA